MNAATETAANVMLTRIFCALQEGDDNGELPGALIQQARGMRDRGEMTADESAWLDDQVSFWCSVNAHRRWA